MSFAPQSETDMLRRNASYVGINKRRLMRSSTRKGNLEPVQTSTKNFNPACTQNVGSQLRKNSKKLEALNKQTKQFGKEKQNNDRINRNQIHAIVDLVQTSVSLKSTLAHRLKINENQDRGQQALSGNLNLKKNKSMRILTRKPALQWPIKLPQNKIDRISQNSTNQYKSLPMEIRAESVQSDLGERQINLVMISSLSPIQRRNEKPQRASEVSGFSILEDIDQPTLSNIEARCQPFTNLEHLHQQTELKMPKVMKRHLPKDFFLRV